MTCWMFWGYRAPDVYRVITFRARFVAQKPSLRDPNICVARMLFKAMGSDMSFIQRAALSLAVATAPMIAQAELAQITDRNDFVELVQGKKLTRPLVELQVSPDGDISGVGVRWDITGNWSWQNRYFCRDLNWGGDDLGYNCQEVRYDGRKIRFTSDQGAGDSADFRLR